MTKTAWLSTGVALTCAAALSAQTPSFSSRVDTVRVDVLATDRDQTIRGLGPADFEVLDNGVLQKVDLVSRGDAPLNVVLALDMSASVAGEPLTRLRTAGRGLLGGLKSDDKAGLVTFSHKVSMGAALTPDAAAVRTALDRTVAAGNTALIDGSYAAIMLGERDAGRSLVIVFSDGIDTASWLPPQAVLDAAKRSDAVVYGVSVDARAKADFLRDLTNATGGRLWEVDKTANLSSVFLGVLEEFRGRYLVSYTPRGVPADGWHKLDVRLKNHKGTVKARPGYLAN